MRVGLCVAAALAVSAWAGPGCGAALAQARAGYPQPGTAGQYGGGFIEYLITGGGQPRALRPNPVGAGGSLPGHPAAYGYGGPGTRRLQSGDPLPDDGQSHGPSYGQSYSQASLQGSAPVRLAALPQAPEPAGDVARIARAIDPQFLRQVVPYTGAQRPGTIVIDTPSRHLYLVQPGGQAIRYGIGVGRPGFAWSGLKTVSQKKEWPDWTPPPEMLKRRPDLPRHMEGGPQNPLGARALYLGSSLYRIHGTNEPHTIGQSVSSGCIRMMNEDVIDLYERAPVGTRVEVL
ncbi:L,D-transpeptidase [Methylobacterium planeticum]|uniref:L,D-transpeptidase n=1 Tax=Methylobacterium planeticum TaxID=2615211 RepID=A0A6N6MJC1_9HYPH|nr:L,D-transpeptidase [Methylobacterium planeticum]KAB1068285.1 L,D-transpeptidase [Methylobacterium planeticum]